MTGGSAEPAGHEPGRAHVHGLAGPPLETTPAVRRAVAVVLVPLVLATVVGLVWLWPKGERPSLDTAAQVTGTVVALGPCAQLVENCQQASVLLDEGPDAGTEVSVPAPAGAGAPPLAPGDPVVLAYTPDAPPEARYELVERQRGTPLLVLAVAFGLAVVVLSRWRGLAALAALGITLVVLTGFVLPALLVGRPPLAVAVVGASTIMVCSLYLAHGLHLRTSIALLGTLVSLTITGVLGAVFVTVGRFTGLAEESSAYLSAVAVEVDVRGLLLAGLVIGALGVLDDVTVTQTAAVWEVARADRTASRRALMRSGMRIGRDHVASTVTTLVLAYAGAALPLLVLFAVADAPWTDVVTTELVAQEVVRALVGGIGIVSAVPVTTGLAVLAVRPRGAAAGRPDVAPTVGGWTPD